MPSLFSNESSRGPLYQYWKERGSEEKALRDQRVQEAQIRSKGFTPMDAAYGPSSKESYLSREERGPPVYANQFPSTTTESSASGNVTAAATAPGMEVPSNDLPPYVDTTATSPTQDHLTGPGANHETLHSASEEKARLQRLEEQHRMTQSDAAIARSLSTDEGRDGEGDAEGKGKQPERKKSTVGKVGRWLADAATGYTKKQERW